MPEYYIKVTIEENKTIEVRADNLPELRRLVNGLTSKFFPKTPWTENDL
ncbi:hypothetical protein NMY3_01222 [Candidatus Nitrosocosmicus oleophilus]|uniref:Uncharacterized protein n=1 Tax=Candidatus Nitrosocosmicus oleophilus TaxID=1353260 RepID=A0A654LWN7_9ARCH|nr:hypothetical protein [Candidatus Nitrosocosmicus oleophilus]ALI35427.1 hypothetical protein NMY3_01222 [Candidatus Nitrosocosmicus oleophilus]